MWLYRSSRGAIDCDYNGVAYSCPPCAAGTYSDTPEASSCTECPAGYYSDSGAIACTACPPGSIGSASCQSTCPAGQGIEDASTSYSNSDETCGNCSPGNYNNGTGLYCTACPLGTFSSVGASSCSSTCPAGTGVESTTNPSSSQSNSPNVCGSCKIGYANNGSSIYCSACSLGTVATSTGSSACSFCPAGSGVNNGDSSSTSNSALLCAACAEGYFQNGNSIYCSACTDGSISNGKGAVNCTTTCSAGEGIYDGSSSLSNSLQVCSNCSLGYFHSPSIASLTCIACPLGTAANVNGSVSCTACSNSAAADSQLAATSCVSTCPAGLGAQQGYSSQSASDEACGSCLEGFYQSGDQLFCSECSATQYTTKLGATWFQTCSFPRQSYFQYWQSSSGEYHSCSAVCLGVSIKTIVIVLGVFVGFMVLCFLVFIPNKQRTGKTAVSMKRNNESKEEKEEGKETAVDAASFDYNGNTSSSNEKNEEEEEGAGSTALSSKWNMGVVLFVYCFIPIFDLCSDLAYILSAQYYSWALFILSCGAIALPMTVFFARLLKRRAFARFRLWSMPASLFFDEYDNIFKLIITGLAAIPYIVINLPVVLPLSIIGVLLNATKLIAIVPISNVWYELWTGNLNFRNTEAIIDTLVLNESIYTGIFCQTFFHSLVQAVNNTLLNRWDVLAYISIVAGGLNAVNGIYQVLYFKFYLKQNLFNRPVTLTFGGLISLPSSFEIPATKHSKVVLRETVDMDDSDDDRISSATTDEVVGNNNHDNNSRHGANHRRQQRQQMRGSDVEMRSSVLSIISNPIHHAKIAVTKGMLNTFKKEVHGEIKDKISREELHAELEAVKEQLKQLQQTIQAKDSNLHAEDRSEDESKV